MKAHIFIALGAAALISTGLHAQSAYDAYSLSPYQRGTARFIGMGGAFTSLGSDLSAMTQNPGGLGLYRSSDIGLTFDISPRSYKATTNTGVSKDSQTKAYFDNIGYVGVMKFNGFFSSLQWGVSYNIRPHNIGLRKPRQRLAHKLHSSVYRRRGLCRPS